MVDGGGRWLLENMGRSQGLGPGDWILCHSKAIALQRWQANAACFTLFKEPSAGPGEMALPFRVLPALALDPSLVSSTYAVQLTATCNRSSRGLDLPLDPAVTNTRTHAHTL